MDRIIFCVLICLTALTGCQKELKETGLSDPQSSQNQSVRYQISINRTTTIEKQNESGQNSPETMTEELIVDLSLQSVNRTQGQVVFKAVCDSVHMLRTDFVGVPTDAEALQDLKGEEFILVMSREGNLLDDSSVQKFMKSTVEDSLKKTCKGTFKEPDMLVDFYNVVTDLCAATAQKQYSQGQSFTRHESTPIPAVEFPLPQRQITCTVDQIDGRGGVRIAKISEVHTMAEEARSKSLGIYPDSVKTEGLFSALRRWRTQSIEGTGEKVVNLDTGLPESLSQHWQVKATAGYAIPIRDAHPVISIDQSVEVKQIK